MPKSQEQRIKDAAEALRTADQRKMFNASFEEVAQIALEAADAPPKPQWPTDEQVHLYRRAESPQLPPRALPSEMEPIRAGLREAMLADPIFKAAVAYRDAKRGLEPTFAPIALDLIAAVNEAGL